MSGASDQPDFGEVKGLLRRLETTTQAGKPEGARDHPPNANANPPRPARVHQGPSSAATLFLIANTVMTTATMTSIAWYLFHASEMQKNRAGAPAGAIEWPPRGSAAVDTGTQSPPQPAAPLAVYLVTPNTFDIMPGTPARMSWQLVPREAISSVDHVSVRGLPSDMIFNAGNRVGSDAWAVPVGMLSELELLSAPNARAGRHDLILSARSADGRELATAATVLVVAEAAVAEPAAETPAADTPATETPAAQARTPAPLDASAQANYLAKAREFVTIGQVSSARLLLQRAAESGNADAALALGDTYDPVYLFQWGVRGLVGDVDRATFWYNKADELGSPDAKARIANVRRQ